MLLRIWTLLFLLKRCLCQSGLNSLYNMGQGAMRPLDGFTHSRFLPGKEVNYRQEEKKILDSVLGPDVYDKRIRPSGLNSTDSASLVTVNIFVRSFSNIDDVKMEYSFQITLRQQWNDGRLRFKDKLLSMEARIGDKFDKDKIRYLTMTDSSKVWMPDTFFRNEKIGRFHNILQDNLYVRVFPNGDVLYSIRVSLTCACSMHLALFPLDKQTCNLDVASYGWTMNDLIYQWKETNPVQMVANLSLPGGFKLDGFTNHNCDVKTATGSYSCLRVEITFARQLSFYVLTIYIPCFMIVLVSWMSFWIDHKAVPARVSLGITTLLAMSTTQASINSSLPPVAYTKAIDVWCGVCVTFVFSALLEYALVNYASRSDAQRAAKQKEAKERELEQCAFSTERIEDGGFPLSMDPLMRRIEGAPMIPPGGLLQNEIPLQVRRNPISDWCQRFQFRAKKIDVISRFLFPSTFAFFNILYWSYYLTQEQQTSKKK
ncbi:glutamate-gated chloride channel isoform X3 [Lepeophtheirus salmonis]|uniref:glutamate-gated chloride channel isoform X3 n=1 Tax=Lepeophtheirus salmonis TaxID=72036 RepID=UPI003AF3C4D6